MPLNHHSLINGTYLPPGDKSISHRILILAGQAIGKSQIFNLLEGEDVINTLKVMKLLGIRIKKKERNLCFKRFWLSNVKVKKNIRISTTKPLIKKVYDL